MSDALLAALGERPAFSALTAGDLQPLPAIGTAHGHVRLPGGLLARVAYAHEGDPTAVARLVAQAAAFHHLAPAGRTPGLHDVIEPRPGLPGGALIVDFIEGRAPRLPDELAAIANTLVHIHSLPTARVPIPRQKNPFIETLEAIEQNAMRFLDKAVPDSGARAEIAEELRLMRGMALAFAQRDQPLTVALLLPLFFTYSGLNTKIGLLNSGFLWLMCGAVLVAAVVGKGVACWVAARATGVPNREALGIGTLMNARGLMELIIINIGLQRGIISEGLFATLVIMAVVTTLMASPLFERLVGSGTHQPVPEPEAEEAGEAKFAR